MAQRKSTTRAQRETMQNREPRKSGVPKPSALVIGEELEYRIARLYIFLGYFVRRGCPIYTVGLLDQATDLDVMALRYVEPIQRELLITECKSGGASPLDRVFWLTGVKQYVKATQASLVRTKGTKWNIKDFAKECGVSVLDLSRIEEIEKALKIGNADWPGISERTFYEAAAASWNKAIVAEPRYWELYQTLISEVRFDDPFAGINYLLSQLRIITRTWKTLPKEPAYRFLLSESITQLAVFLMRVVEVSFDLSPYERRGLIRKGLTYGNLEPQYAERILTSAYNMTRQAVVHYTNRFVDIDRSLFSMPTPPSTDEVIGFVDELFATYPINLAFAQVCDLILSEVFTKQKDTQGWLRRIFPQPDLAARVGLMRRFITLLVSIDACPVYVKDSIDAVINHNKAERVATPATIDESEQSRDQGQAMAVVPPTQSKVDPDEEKASGELMAKRSKGSLFSLDEG